MPKRRKSIAAATLAILAGAFGVAQVATGIIPPLSWAYAGDQQAFKEVGLATVEEQDELPVFQYFQRDATYYGFEAEASAQLFRAARANEDIENALLGGVLGRVPVPGGVLRLRASNTMKR